MPSPTTTTAPGPASPAEPLRPPVTAAASAERVRRRGVLLYAEHQLRNMRRYGAVLLVGALGEPVLYLLAMGLGLAQLMGGGMPQDALGGVSYVAFIAPALLASGALMTASVEFSYPVMGGFQWQRTYYAAQATPLSPAQIALGHLAAVSLRFVFQAAVFLLVMLAFGVVSSPWAWVQVLTATLGGLAVGAPIMAFAASLKEDKGQFATLQRLVVMPLFLFSATFYPLEALPVWLRWIGWLSPQWHAAQLGRHRLALLGVHVENGDLHAIRGQQPRRRSAQPRCTAGNHRRQTLKFHVYLPIRIAAPALRRRTATPPATSISTCSPAAAGCALPTSRRSRSAPASSWSSSATSCTPCRRSWRSRWCSCRWTRRAACPATSASSARARARPTPSCANREGRPSPTGAAYSTFSLG